MCDPIPVTLLKIKPHYSQSSRENATPSGSASLSVDDKEVSPPPSPGSILRARDFPHCWILAFRICVFVDLDFFSVDKNAKKYLANIQSTWSDVHIFIKAILATTLVSDQLYLRPPLWNPRLNGDLNFVMKTSRKRSRPLFRLPNWTFPLFLSSCKRPFNSFVH